MHIADSGIRHDAGATLYHLSDTRTGGDACAVCDVSAAGCGGDACAVCDVSAAGPERDAVAVAVCDVSTGGAWREPGAVYNGRRAPAGGMRFPYNDADAGSEAGRDSNGDPVPDWNAVSVLVRSLQAGLSGLQDTRGRDVAPGRCGDYIPAESSTAVILR
ncbi:hypothetical protein NicSoilB8_21510 [Arthrobacter sp. NicSoilB8]|nr:hypothetical protein NicSoilB8_21510 [Arthrobacter sp. NicSoilB8]